MFKFNFAADCDDTNGTEKVIAAVPEKIQWLPAQEIFISDVKSPDQSDLFDLENLLACGNLNIFYYDSTSMLHLRTEKLALLTELENQHSDLLAGKYEGGFKIWECTFDLINFMSKNMDMFQFDNAKVLDLGCGAGIIGLYAMLRGATVYFQDYNSDVLKILTMPNVILNKTKYKELESSVQRFFSGDWDSFCDLLISDRKFNEEDKFDYILTTETIYNTDNYEKLYTLFKKLLKTKGDIFVSAKSHYFGVGGSINEFIRYISKEDKFDSKTLWECDQGVRRSIVKIAFKNPD